MPEVLLINPRRRKRRRTMTAKQARYFGKRRRRRSRIRAAAPTRRRRRRSRALTVYRPRRRRSVVRAFRRRRRNPTVRGITAQFIPTAQAGFFGALGGLANDTAYGFTKRFLPAQLQTGLGRSAAKILSAVLVGFIANWVLPGRGRGKDLAVGAATVVLHEALKEQLVRMAPQLPLGEYDMGYLNPGEYIANEQVGAYLTDESGMSESVGAYLEPEMAGYDND